MKKIHFLLIILVLSTIITNNTHALSLIENNTIDDGNQNCTKFQQDLRLYDGPNNKKSEAVFELQNSLIQENYLKTQSTGFFGLLTLNALKKYQRDHGLPNTGYMGKMTRRILRNQFCQNEFVPICDYAAPPQGCNYVPGPDYNPNNQCGMVLFCS